MRRQLNIGLCALMLAGSIGTMPLTAQAGSKAPSYVKADCEFVVSSDATVECGYLTVLENRSKPDGPTIRLHVAVFKTQAADRQPDPIIYLDGGPGAPTLYTADSAFQADFSQFAAKRDFIMFDQRGVGYSKPSLDCPELTDLAYNSLGKEMSYQEENQTKNKAVQVCRNRLIKTGIDINAYTTAASAADVNDLRIALGYKAWNLYGISYGTRLALTVMRDFPQGVRSVILDSIVTPQADLFGSLPTNAERAFKVFFNGCAQDIRCSIAYPKLESVFYKAVDKLSANPVIVTVQHPITGKKYDTVVDGKMLINTLFQMLYSTDAIAYLPKYIFRIRDGDYGFLARLQVNGVVGSGLFSQGMYYSVQCAEEISFDTRQRLDTADQNFPQQHHGLSMSGYYSICKIWNVPGAPAIENKAVTSDLPTLIMSGEYDPITPPSNGQDAAKTLTNSFFFTFPGIGHGTSVAASCPEKIVNAFLQDPTHKPASDCINMMTGPQFALS